MGSAGGYCFNPVAAYVPGVADMKDKTAAILIFILLTWWVIDEYIEGAEYELVMQEHHAHFALLNSWHKEWRGMIDTYIVMWNNHHPPPDCEKDND